MSEIADLTLSEAKEKVLRAAKVAIGELIKVLQEPIIDEFNDKMRPDLAADKMKNAAAAKKLAMFDALDMIDRIKEVEEDVAQDKVSGNTTTVNFAEKRVKKK